MTEPALTKEQVDGWREWIVWKCRDLHEDEQAEEIAKANALCNLALQSLDREGQDQGAAGSDRTEGAASALTSGEPAAHPTDFDAGLERAAKVCDKAYSEPGWNSMYRQAADSCANAIRALKGTPK